MLNRINNEFLFRFRFRFYADMLLAYAVYKTTHRTYQQFAATPHTYPPTHLHTHTLMPRCMKNEKHNLGEWKK